MPPPPAGAIALAPPRPWLDEALERGGKDHTFAFFEARVVAPGPRESLLRTRSGLEERLPNALIVPLRPGARAAKGKLVLAAMASGAGLARGWVTGGTPESPTVRYVDRPWDDPTGWAQRDDTLPPDTFQVLEKPGVVGTTLACGDETLRQRWVVLQQQDGKVLGLGFGGRVEVLDLSRCTAVPLAPKVQPGAAVHVPDLGRFVPARVKSVDAEVGRVVVEVEAGGKKREERVGFGNVLP